MHGPFEIMVIKFPGNRFTGEIVPALREVVEKGIIRIVDAVFVRKDADGSVEALEVSDLGAEEVAAFESLGAHPAGLLSEDDVSDVAGGLEPNSSAALVVWENVWASSFVEAVRNADGHVLVYEPISAEIVEAARAAAVQAQS
jgi:uncharacterized membrane protein